VEDANGQWVLWGVLCLTASCAYGAGMVLYLLHAR
jgi:hypothetical protein